MIRRYRNPADPTLRRTQRRWRETGSREDLDLYVQDLTRAGRRAEALVLIVNNFPGDRGAWEELMLASHAAGQHVIYHQPRGKSVGPGSEFEDFVVLAIRQRPGDRFAVWTITQPPRSGWWTSGKGMAGAIRWKGAYVRLEEGPPQILRSTRSTLECMQQHMHGEVEAEQDDYGEPYAICSRCFTDFEFEDLPPWAAPECKPAYHNLTAWGGKPAVRGNPPLTRPQWDELVRLLLDEGWDYKRAAAHFNVSTQAISYHMKTHRPFALRIYRKRRGLREIR